MSCRQAFDLAFHCQSVGGQFLSVYREGGMRSCSTHWEDFWFCMRTKSYSPEMKQKLIRDHYRKKEAAKYGNGKPSSEDVWEARTERVPLDSAFSERYDAPAVSDEDWQRLQMERTRRIREELARGRGEETTEGLRSD
jgi:hypothetical protein